MVYHYDILIHVDIKGAGHFVEKAKLFRIHFFKSFHAHLISHFIHIKFNIN